MYWRSEKEIIESFVSVFRRLFTYLDTISNAGFDVITLPTGSLPSNIFEAYASKDEEYPSIRVDSTGITWATGLNNLFRIIDDQEEYLGYRPVNSIIATNNHPVLVKLPSSFKNSTIRGFSIPLASVDLLGGDDVELNVYKNYTTSPELVSSGFLFGNNSDQYKFSFGPISPSFTVENDDYWLEIIPKPDNEYIFGIDDSVDSIYTGYENNIQVNKSGSLHASALSPAFIRLGGRINGSVIIKCSSKDNSATARNLASLIAIYTNILTQAKISRKTDDDSIVNKLKLVFGTKFTNDEWLDKGIRITNIRQNAVNYRKRSDNEIIYEATVLIDFWSEWFHDAPANILEEIPVEIYSLLPGFIKTETIVTGAN